MGKYEVLAKFLEIDDLDDIESQGEKEFDTPSGRYMVLTDVEADDLADQALDSQLDDFVLPQIPELLQIYFDGAAWKKDALLDGGRGSVISSYDGDENEEQDTDGEYYYIYRMG